MLQIALSGLRRKGLSSQRVSQLPKETAPCPTSNSPLPGCRGSGVVTSTGRCASSSRATPARFAAALSNPAPGTASGFDASGAVALAGQCCVSELTEIFGIGFQLPADGAGFADIERRGNTWLVGGAANEPN